MSVLRALFLLLLWVAWPALGKGPATPSAVPAKALDLLDVGAPSFTNFSARDGLPDTVIVAIRTDREGFVWAASPEGVFRYDGHRWTASPDLAMAQDVDSLWLDSHGTLWAAFRSRGLASYDGADWHVENLSTGLPSQQVRRFTESVDANRKTTLWAATWDRGLMVHRNGRWQADPDNDSLPSGTVLSIVQTQHIGGHRRLWVGMGSQGLWYRDEGTRGWRQWHVAGIDSSQVEYLLANMHHGHEELWISVFSRGLYRLTDEGLRRWSKESGELPTNEIYDIAATTLPDNDSAIWVSSRSGLLRVHDDLVQVFDRRHGLSSDAVRGLNAWRSPNGADVIWLATEAGVSRTVIGANAWSTASLMGARSIGVFGVLVEADGSGGERLWVGASDDGLGLYAHGRWRYFTEASGALPAASVSMVAVTTGQAGKRTHWIGLRGGDLLQANLRGDDSLTFEPQKTPWPKTSGQAVMDTLVRNVDGHDEQWVATRQTGVYRWRDGRWTAFRPDAARGQWAVIKLQEQLDASGRSWLWASTNQGLARFDGQQWKLFGQGDGLLDPHLSGLSLIDDARGHPVLWAGTSSAGIARVDVSDPSQPRVLPDTLPSPPDAGTYDAMRDSAGRIYICTNNGLQQLTPGAGGHRSRVFTRRDGMVHDECNTNARFIDSHDRYWTGTLGGLTVYDPHREADDRLPKPLRITGVSVEGKPLQIDQTLASGLTVGPGKKSVEVQFALLSWYREGESRFRTQLVGFDDAPGEWSPQVTRAFTTLPPGSYRLHVEARDYAGNLSTPIDLSIAVEAPWWQRAWARVAAVFALLLLSYATVQWRTRRLQAQRQALELRVVARTAELDEANARLVELSYHDALTAVANRRRLLEQLQHLDCTTATGSPAVDHALIFVDVDQFKACNDRFGHPAGDEVLRMIATTMLRCAPDDALVARYGGEEFACLMHGANSAQAAVVAECMRVAVAACRIAVPEQTATMQVTISAGVASTACQDIHYTHHHLLRDADLALYLAKSEGRNCVRTRQGTECSGAKSEGS
jgi:diguanylate cyclase (GGDEF)-like protein